MKTLFTFLLSAMFLFLFYSQTEACDLDPTAVIDILPDEVVFLVGDSIYMEAYNSSPNCGYISGYRWQVEGATESTSGYFIPNLTLQTGEDSRSFDIQLRVQNSVGNYGYKTVTITIVREHSSYYYLTDHLGSVRVTVDDDGNSVGWDDYYPFGLQMPGRTQNQTNPQDDQKFTGYELEQQGDLGLYHAEARMYDPVIGRFNSVDPLAAEFPSWSPYLYVGNDPISFIDPTGKYRVHKAAYDENGVVSLITRLNLNSLSRDERLTALGGLAGPVGSVFSAVKMAKMGMKQDNAWQAGFWDYAGLFSAGLTKLSRNPRDIGQSIIEGGSLGTAAMNSFITSEAGRDQVLFDVAKQFGGGGLFESGNGYAGYTNSLVLNQGFANAIEGGRDGEGLDDVTAFTKNFFSVTSAIITGIANSQGFDLTTEHGRKATLNHYQTNKKKYDDDIKKVFNMIKD